MLRRVWSGVLAVLMLLAFATPVFAQAAGEPEERLFDFEGDTVAADVLKPDASIVDAVTRRERKSLIKLRVDFVDEIVRSAEDI